MDSILNSIKQQIGITNECVEFDESLIIHINSAFFVLNQLGVGPEDPFSITDSSTSWSDFLNGDTSIEAVKTYMALKVQLLFDPPSSSALLDAKNRQLSEFEWRLNISAELKTS